MGRVNITKEASGEVKFEEVTNEKRRSWFARKVTPASNGKNDQVETASRIDKLFNNSIVVFTKNGDYVELNKKSLIQFLNAKNENSMPLTKKTKNSYVQEAFEEFAGVSMAEQFRFKARRRDEKLKGTSKGLETTRARESEPYMRKEVSKLKFDTTANIENIGYAKEEIENYGGVCLTQVELSSEPFCGISVIPTRYESGAWSIHEWSLCIHPRELDDDEVDMQDEFNKMMDAAIQQLKYLEIEPPTTIVVHTEDSELQTQIEEQFEVWKNEMKLRDARILERVEKINATHYK